MWVICGFQCFIAQLVRALHHYREVTGSNAVEVLNFAKIAFITVRIIASLDFISAVHILYDPFHISFHR